MSDERQRRERAEALVAQDPHIDDTSTKEFRMQLEDKLAEWESRGTRLRRIGVAVVIVYGCLVLFALLVLNGAPAGSFRGMLAAPWMILTWATLIVGLYAAAIYTVRYRPAARKLRYDIQNSMILELQEQVAALREEIHKRP